MALIQLTAIVSGIKGSLAGTTFLRSRAGLSMRTKTSPILRRTDRTSTFRNRLANITSQWRDLTFTQQTGWVDTAASLPKTNAFGQTYYWTGLQLFTSYNMYRIEAGNPIQYTVPSPWLSVQILEAYGYGYFNTGNPGLNELFVVPDWVSGDYGDQVLIYATPWVPNINSYVADKFRLLGQYEAGESDEVNILNEWQALFQAPDRVGFIWIRMIPYSTTGNIGTVYEFFIQNEIN